MKSITIGSHTYEIYTGVEELPIARFQKYNQMIMQAAGIGSNLSDADQHLERACLYAAKGDCDSVLKELETFRTNLMFIQQDIDPKSRAFAALVKSVDGEPWNDISDDGLSELQKMLHEGTANEVDQAVNPVKKKIETELSTFFSDLFGDDVYVKEYYDKLKSVTDLQLDALITGEDKSQEIASRQKELLIFFKPKRWSVEELKQAKEFEVLCLELSQEFHCDAKQMTTFAFYSAVEHLNLSIKKKQQFLKRNGRQSN